MRGEGEMGMGNGRRGGVERGWGGMGMGMGMRVS